MPKEKILIEGSDRNQKRHKQFLLNLITQSESQRETREKIWRENIMNYNNLTGRMWYRGRANIHVPLTYQAIETIFPRVKAGIFSQRPFFDVRPPGNDEKDKVDADIAKSLLSYQNEKQIKLRKKFSDIGRTAEIIGTVICKMFWRHEEQMIMVNGKEEKKVMYDGPDLTVMDPFSMFVDEYTEDHDINRARWVIHRSRKTWEELKEMYGDNVPNDMHKQGEFNEGDETRSIRLASGSDTSEETDIDPSLRTFTHHEIWHDWNFNDDDGNSPQPRSKNTVAVIIDNKVMARAQRNGFRHGKKPFLSYSPSPRTDQFWGNGTCDITRRLQYEANDTRNQMMDWRSRALNQMVWVGRAAGIDDDQIVYRQGGIIRVNDISQVREMAHPNIVPIAQSIELQLEENIRSATGATRALQGVPLNTVRSATESSGLLNEGSVRTSEKVEEFENQFLLPYLEMQWSLNQQFIKKDKMIRLIQRLEGPMAAEAIKEVGPISPDDIAGDIDIVMKGSLGMALDGAKGQSFMQFVQLLLQLDPTMAQNQTFIKKSLFKMWTDVFKLDATEFAETMNEMPIEDLASRVVARMLEGAAGEPGTPAPDQPQMGPGEQMAGEQMMPAQAAGVPSL